MATCMRNQPVSNTFFQFWRYFLYYVYNIIFRASVDALCRLYLFSTAAVDSALFQLFTILSSFHEMIYTLLMMAVK